jgi:PEP-CTERM motif-containing protein
MRKLDLLLASICMGIAVPANAGIVYDNGTPNGTGGNLSGAWVQAEDFSFGSATNVDGAGIYIGTVSDIAAWDGSFTYYIFSDSGGSPGALLASGSVSPTVTPTGFPDSFGNAYLFAFDFNSAFDASGGAIYWLGIHTAADFNSNGDLFWANTDNNGTATGHESFGGTFDNWSDNNKEHAFHLTGLTSGVPEPSTWAMMILGFGAAGVALRRRRAVKLALA